MSGASQEARAEPAASDREIVITRVIDAPRELVFEAFTEVRHLSRWWGPEGFTTTTRAFEFRVGGERSRQLPLPDCVGQVGHPLRRLCADRLQGHAACVHALVQADSGAEQHG